MQRLVVIAGLTGLLITAFVPLGTHLRIQRAERKAIQTLVRVREAHIAFRAGGGHGGYAGDLASLTTPCPGEARAALSAHAVGAGAPYRIVLRGAAHAQPLSVDCHGRPALSDYYAAAAPREAGVDGMLALAMTASGGMFAFVDAVAPLEADMAAGGTALPFDVAQGRPLDAMGPVQIP